MGLIKISITPLSKSQIRPIRLCPKIKKAHHLLIWQSGLFYLITHGNPFLSVTHFLFSAVISFWI